MSKKQRKSSVKNGNLMTPQTLHQISNSLAYLVVNSGNLKGKKQQDLVPILSDLGFDKKVIAAVLQAEPETVSERLSEIKAARKKAKKKSNGSVEEAEHSETIEQPA
jgi:SOS response regulatory protein OraA/RecX